MLPKVLSLLLSQQAVASKMWFGGSVSLLFGCLLARDKIEFERIKHPYVYFYEIKASFKMRLILQH